MAKTQPQEKVILETVKPVVAKKTGIVTREFDYEEAKSLLKHERAMKQKEWQLPKDSQYQFTDNGDLIKRASPEIDKGAAAPKGDPGSEGQADKA